jgi:hypothetical protein
MCPPSCVSRRLSRVEGPRERRVALGEISSEVTQEFVDRMDELRD